MTDRTAEFLLGDSNRFKNVIDKVRNGNLGDATAWETAQPLLRYLEKIDPSLRGHLADSGISRQLFNAVRTKFLDPNDQRALEIYKKAKRAILSPMSDEEFFQMNTVAQLYESELFRNRQIIMKSGKS